eukprot:3342900-Rhodomonas_salina.1
MSGTGIAHDADEAGQEEHRLRVAVKGKDATRSRRMSAFCVGFPPLFFFFGLEGVRRWEEVRVCGAGCVEGAWVCGLEGSQRPALVVVVVQAMPEGLRLKGFWCGGWGCCAEMALYRTDVSYVATRLLRGVRLSDGRWHHVAVTWRAEDGRVQDMVTWRAEDGRVQIGYGAL